VAQRLGSAPQPEALVPHKVRFSVSTDEDLVERARRGDRAAFRALFLAHRTQTSRLLSRLVPHSEVEDVTQEVFLQVHRSLSAFRGESRFSTWLYRLTFNVARMHLRRQRARPKLNLAGQDEAGQLEQAAPETPQHSAERHERLRALGRLLVRLSDKKREALILHDFQGVSAEEIAHTLEVPVMTVRTRVFYARRELYAALAEEPALAALVESLSTSAARSEKREAPEPLALLTEPQEGKQ
jgi:RNA polymerase sigma-70 factor (ECF subfamily)